MRKRKSIMRIKRLRQMSVFTSTLIKMIFFLRFTPETMFYDYADGLKLRTLSFFEEKYFFLFESKTTLG
jgi:hypothetical protein